MISDYLIEFGGGSTDIEKKGDELTREWNQLLKDLAMKKGGYEHEVTRLKTLESDMAQYESWLNEQKRNASTLPILSWTINQLDEQTKCAKVSEQ